MPTENPGRGDIIIAGGMSHRIGNPTSIDFGGIVAFFATMLTKSQRHISLPNHTLNFMPSENPFRGGIFVAGGMSHRIGNPKSIDFGGIVAFFLQQC